MDEIAKGQGTSGETGHRGHVSETDECGKRLHEESSNECEF